VQDEVIRILEIYEWPSQAFWRCLEYDVLKRLSFEHPVLEIGCGDGRFSSLIFDVIEDAIDINPRSVQKCLDAVNPLYRRVRCLDARNISFEDGGYATVFANCVLEHIPEVEGVLLGCFRGLRPGGRFVFTVPLEAMDRHLLFRSQRYAAMRRRQLSHVNLFSSLHWEELLQATGFQRIEIFPYLYEKECRFWDSFDAVGCIGRGRYNLANATRLLVRMVIGQKGMSRILRMTVGYLSRKFNPQLHSGEPCAALLIATKP